MAANVPDPNLHIADYTIYYRALNSEIRFDTKAYGPLWTKVLARWYQAGIDTGEFVQRNADNFAIFALAKYVQNRLGIYPHLPLVSYEPLKAPDFESSPYIAPFVVGDDDFYLNDTGLNQTIMDNWGLIATTPGCADTTGNANDTNSDYYPPLSINAFSPTSAYPDDYNSQISSWISDLTTVSSTALPPTVTTTASTSEASDGLLSPDHPSCFPPQKGSPTRKAHDGKPVCQIAS